MSSRIGDSWIKHLEDMKQLEPLAEDTGFSEQNGATLNKPSTRDMASQIHNKFGILVDPASLFDVQIKRIHEYKRQHLNAHAHCHPLQPAKAEF